MKIILVHYKFYVQGGPEKYMFNFIDLATKNGAEVYPFSVNFENNEKCSTSNYFYGDKNAGANFDKSNRSLSYLAKGFYHEFHNYSAAKKFEKMIDEVNPDVIYILILGQLSTDIIKVAKKKHIPTIMRISDFRMICGKNTCLRNEEICEDCIFGRYSNCVKNKCIKNSLSLSLLRAMSLNYARKKKVYDYLDAIITPPIHTKELLLKSKIVNSKKIFVNPTFINVNVIEPSFSRGDYVLCLGRFSREKGFNYAIEAMSYLKDINIKLFITGSKDDLDEKMRFFIEEHNLYDKIVFTGFIKGKKLENMIKQCLCVLAPAIWYENQPNSILESFAYGKPVIGSNIGSIANMINENNGILVQPKNSYEISEAIRKMLDDDLYYKLSHGSREYVETYHSPSKHWETFVNIYSLIK